MSKREEFQKATLPVRLALRGWAFATVERRRAQVERAKKLVPELPENAQQWARDEIAAVEAHC